MRLRTRLALRALAGDGDVDVAVLHETPVGIKARNQLVRSELLAYPFLQPATPAELDPAGLLLGIDGLKDRFTLLGTSLWESPHYALAKCLLRGRPLGRSVYVSRARAGTLDLRPPARIDASFVGRLQRRFEESLRALDTGVTATVRIVRLGDETYIADGKHRAALALARNETVRCEDATAVYYDSFFAWMRRAMDRRPTEYVKHLEAFELVEQERAREGVPA